LPDLDITQVIAGARPRQIHADFVQFKFNEASRRNIPPQIIEIIRTSLVEVALR